MLILFPTKNTNNSYLTDFDVFKNIWLDNMNIYEW